MVIFRQDDCPIQPLTGVEVFYADFYHIVEEYPHYVYT
jgi:hypothetical protein